jgi:radical SAM protein with 4Fe4S-binding SPASM domain
MHFSETIQDNKIQYLNAIKKETLQKTNIVIYGAGWISRILYKLLTAADIEVCAFCVTEKSYNTEKQYGIRVFQIDQLLFDKNNTLILVGVKDPWNKEVVELLQMAGWTYLDLPKHVVDFDDEKSYADRPVIEVTTRIGCNVQCRYCPQELLQRTYYKCSSRQTQMSFNMFKQSVDKLPNDAVVIFAGFAESFLNPESVKMMQYADEKRFTVCLFSTFVGCTLEMFQSISKIPFARVLLHVPDIDGYANIPITDEYLSLLDTIMNAKKVNGMPFVDNANCQSTPHPKVLKYLKGKVSIASELCDRAGNLDKDDRLSSSKGIKGNIYCTQSYNLSRNILLPDGSLALCCMDYGLKHIIGNLLQNSYQEIMSSNEMNRIRQAMSDDTKENLLCRQCIYARQC